MSPRFLLDHFDLLAEAPGGVARLRELVLRLAVRGKLVPQDPTDEPASELLKRIASERARLVKEGKIRTGKPLPPVGADEAPFEVPEGWVWCRLGELCSHGPSNGWSPPTADYKTSIKTLKLSATTKGIFDSSQTKYIDTELPEDCEYWLQDGDLLIQRSNTKDYVGMAALYSGPEATFIYPDLMMRCKIMSLVSRNYVHRALVSPPGREYLQERASGTSSSMVKVNQNTVASCPIPLPPLAEQHRIVARVDELMALLDRLEAAQGERDTTRLAARDSALAALRDAADPEEVAAAWRRLEARMDDLFQAPEDVPPLRQAILQLAVRGRLVAQEAGDEPAGANARRRGGADEHKEASPIPRNWRSLPLDQVVDSERPISYGVLIPGGDVQNGTPLVRIADLDASRPKATPEKRISHDIAAQYERVRLRGDEILLGVVGSIGKVGVAHPEWRGAVVARAVARFAAGPSVAKGFLVAVLSSPHAQDYFTTATRTLAQPTLNISLIRQLPVPLPPLAEQHRIVARVDELMALCDRLESRLAAAREAQTALAAAAVHHIAQPDFAA